VDLGDPTVSDVCDPAPTVVNDAPALFPLGPTTVTWTATDTSGNVATDEQVVTVVPGSPENQLSNLGKAIEQAVASDDISSEIVDSLLAKVDAAMAALDRGNVNDAKTAMNQLKALINEIEAQSDHMIVPATALELIWRIELIIADLAE
jgi:hypothetical protein